MPPRRKNMLASVNETMMDVEGTRAWSGFSGEVGSWRVMNVEGEKKAAWKPRRSVT